MDIKQEIQKIRFGLSARISLYERLADYLENKFPVDKVLEKISKRYQKKKDYRAEILNVWRRRMANGSKFSDAIKAHIPAEERILIAAGENSGGGLPQGLREAIRLSKGVAAIKSAIISGSAYPAVLIATILFLVSMFASQMAPVFIDILPLSKWDSSALLLYNLSSAVNNYWWMILAIMMVICLILGWSTSRWTGKSRAIADRFPPYSIYKEYQSASFLIALSSMMIAGVGLSESLQKIYEKSSPYMQEHIGKMLRRLRVTGSEYGRALDTGLLSEEVAGDIEDYSALSTFEKAIYGIGEKMIEKTLKSINLRMVVFKQVMLVVVAIMIVWLMGTIYGLQGQTADEASKDQTAVSSAVKN